MPTPQSSSEENNVHADVYRVSSDSTDRSVKRNRLAQKRYRLLLQLIRLASLNRRS